MDELIAIMVLIIIVAGAGFIAVAALLIGLLALILNGVIWVLERRQRKAENSNLKV